MAPSRLTAGTLVWSKLALAPLFLASLGACSDVKVSLVSRKSLTTADASLTSDGSIDAPSPKDATGAIDAVDARDASQEEAAAPVDAALEATADANLGTGRFGTPVLLTALSDPMADDQDPTFTEDEREIYFMSDRDGANQDIWVSHRDDKSLPWQAPTRVAELSSPSVDSNPSISPDGLTIWFSSDREDAGVAFDIWVSARASRQDPWGPPQRVLELSSPYDDFAPSIGEDELTIVFVSNRLGGPGDRDIYISTRPTRGDPWSTPTPVSGSVNTADEEWDPFIGAHGLQIFWGANRAAPTGEEIRWASRASTSAPFDNVVVLDELVRPSFDPSLSIDLHHIVFASSVAGTSDIYEAFR